MNCFRAYLLILIIVAGYNCKSHAQGFFSGGLDLNTNVFINNDTLLQQALPHYQNYKSGGDAWFTLNYINNDFGLEAGVRFDAFMNSILRSPTQPLTQVGIGRWYIRKDFNRVRITAGYIYEQFGTGIAFRSFEERQLGIDNAILGVMVDADVMKNFRVKAFGGLQKNLFELEKPFIKGINGEGYVEIGDKITLLPGGSFVNRTLDEDNMTVLVNEVNALDPGDRFSPNYNNYVISLYNTLNIGRFSWYVEGAYKTKEAVNFGDRWRNTDGNIVFTTLTYTQKGLGITGQFKRTHNFIVQTTPFPDFNTGILNFIPPTARQNSYRLPARYFPISLNQEELAFGVEATYTPAKNLTFEFGGSYIRNLMNDSELDPIHNLPTGPGQMFYTEGFAEARYRFSSKFKLSGGLQVLRFNEIVYIEEKTDNVVAYTPFTEFTYKFNRKLSLKFEGQYQHTIKDFGQWAYGLVELNFAPHWSVSISDMWNFDVNENRVDDRPQRAYHYYSIFGSYRHKAHRFSVNLVRQVAGIVCTGGVCRFEPAFNGMRIGYQTSF